MKTFVVYFKNGDKETFDDSDIFSLAEYLNKAYDIVDIYKIEEV